MHFNKSINEIIQDAKTIGITGHIRPDGDCVGACMALYNYLKKNRPDVSVKVYLEYVDPKFLIIENCEHIDTKGYDGTVYDLFVILDTAGMDRLGLNQPYFENAKRTVCIDHHASNQGFADENYIVPECSSASEVLYDFLEPELINKAVAEPLYMGIAHDSGVFRFQSTTPRTMMIAAHMMEHGINVNRILEDTFYKKTYSQMMITSKIQSQTVLTMDGKCIYGWCTESMMQEYGVTKNELDAVIASIRNVEGVEVAMFVYEMENNRFKVSLRSREIVDVSKIAVFFDGGGHKRAAGFELTGTLDEVIERVLDEVKKEMERV